MVSVIGFFVTLGDCHHLASRLVLVVTIDKILVIVVVSDLSLL